MHDNEYMEAVYESLTLHGVPVESLTPDETHLVGTMVVAHVDPDDIAHAIIDARAPLAPFNHPSSWVAVIIVHTWDGNPPLTGTPVGQQHVAVALN